MHLQPRFPRGLHLPRGGAVVLALGLVAGGCGSGGGGGGSRPVALPSPSLPPSSAAPVSPAAEPASPSPTAAPVDPAAAERAAVLAAWTRYTATVDEVDGSADPQAALRLRTVATGPQLTKALQVFGQLRSAGHVVQGRAVSLRPTVTSVEPARASLTDCVDTNMQYEYDRKAKALTPQSAKRKSSGMRRPNYSVTAQFVRSGGTWLVRAAEFVPNDCH